MFQRQDKQRWIIMVYLLNTHHIFQILSMAYRYILKHFFVSNFLTLFHVSIFVFFKCLIIFLKSCILIIKIKILTQF